MRIAMSQMKMEESVEKNLNKTVAYMRGAMRKGADVIMFPELQLSPFFPIHRKQSVDSYLMNIHSPEIETIKEACRKMGIYASPNVYLDIEGKRYDASLLIDKSGQLVGISKMVHIAQAKNFYEQDYYTPSDDRFKVYDTPFGKIGIVICFDRHIPVSIHSCAKQGVHLILIPTANLTTENIELYEWEIRVQAFQNTVYIAMCNRTGTENGLTFCGQSLIASPDGEILYRADGNEQLVIADIALESIFNIRKSRPWLDLSTPGS
nr:carbon-nitrogen hydrolase family protein [uncultured Ruminococcus sp.]